MGSGQVLLGHEVPPAQWLSLSRQPPPLLAGSIFQSVGSSLYPHHNQVDIFRTFMFDYFMFYRHAPYAAVARLAIRISSSQTQSSCKVQKSFIIAVLSFCSGI